MKNATSLKRIQTLHPKVRQDFIDFLNQCEDNFKVAIYIPQAFRSFEQQDAIYQQGRTTPGKIVSNAPAGSSYHNYGLAVDVVPFKKDGVTLDWDYDFSKWAGIASQYNITWGGDFPGKFKDYDHFENKLGYGWKDLLKLYNQKMFIPGTNFLNI